MNVSLGFPVGEVCCVRRLDLDEDRSAIAALGLRCADYLRQVAGHRFGAKCASHPLAEMLVPTRVPVARSFVFGVFRRQDSHATEPPALVGLLYFLHPEAKPDSWYIPLMLLEPAARGQGIGSAVHEAFASWALARGARRLTVAVADDNPRARSFWCERMGYREVPACARQPIDDSIPWKPEFVRHLATAERVRLTAA